MGRPCVDMVTPQRKLKGIEPLRARKITSYYKPKKVCKVMVLENINNLFKRYNGKLNFISVVEEKSYELEIDMNINIKKDLKTFDINGLEDVNDLARKYRGKFNLNLSVVPLEKKQIINSETHSKLVEWESELQSVGESEPVITVENFVDDTGPPSDFIYVRTNVMNSISKDFTDPSFLVGCECVPSCTKRCRCPANSGGEFAYNKRKMVLLPTGSPIYECNKKCQCSIDCTNRVLQKGLTTKVCIFRTANGRGWGLKARNFIHAGKFVVEYVGEVITSDEAERRGRTYDARQQTYLFDLDFDDKDAMFTIDAYRYGNASRFINHSCDPNLHVYSVWVDSLDPRLPRIGLFAKRDIYVKEELTFDYRMISNTADTDSKLISPNRFSNVTVAPSPAGKDYCACGSANCRKYLF